MEKITLRMSRFIVIAFLCSVCQAAASKSGLKPDDFVAVCGDSITEQKLYSVFIEDYLLMCRPMQNLRVLQAGWSGEVAEGFLARMDQDVLSLRPTVATTCYGMNDGGYGPLDPKREAWYRDNQKKIIQKFKKSGLRLIVLGSPGAVDSDTFANSSERAAIYNKSLGRLALIDQKIAREENVVFANVHDVMMEVMAKAKAKYGKTYHLCGSDGIHPWRNGQLVMAYAFLKALGCDGDIGTITVDLATGKATATEGHRVLSSAKGSATIESTRYPFCFSGDPKSPDATRGVIEFLPFNQDLNRFLLVVAGADPQAEYKVTWGKASKVFRGEDLSKGINLASEFLDNPFSEPFQKVEQAVQAKQNWETLLTKSLLHTLPTYRDALPEEKAAVDKIAAKLISRDKILADATLHTVVPVRHKIQIDRGKK